VNRIILGDVVAVNLQMILNHTTFGTSIISPKRSFFITVKVMEKGYSLIKLKNTAFVVVQKVLELNGRSSTQEHVLTFGVLRSRILPTVLGLVNVDHLTGTTPR